MSDFMQPEIILDTWYRVETSNGTEVIPASLCNPGLINIATYVEGTPEHFEIVEGYGARLSAPGYMDCTEWTVFDTQAEAEEYLSSLDE